MMCAGLRTVSEAMVPKLQRRFCDSREKTLEFPNMELLSLALSNVHPIADHLFWEADRFSFWPSFKHWKVGDNSLASRCFHLHPLITYFPNREKKWKESIRNIGPIDGDYVRMMCDSWEEVHVVTESDELAWIDLSPADFDVGKLRLSRPRSRSLHVVRWASSHTGELHRHYFPSFTIRYKSGEAVDWERVESRIQSDTRWIRLLLPLLMGYKKWSRVSKRLVRKGLRYRRSLGART